MASKETELVAVVTEFNNEDRVYVGLSGDPDYNDFVFLQVREVGALPERLFHNELHVVDDEDDEIAGAYLTASEAVSVALALFKFACSKAIRTL